MIALLLVALAGFGAQLVDGSLGMGYGITSVSLLLATGVAPALASASANLAQLGTTLSSGASHWRAGNVDWTIVRRLALPGGLGGLAGATLLSALSTQAARPVIAVLLVLLGLGVVARFVARPPGAEVTGRAWTRGRWFLGPLGVVGGFVNSTGGGGWGPVVTSSLLATSPVEPRKVIGSVSTAEFLVTVCASVGFVVGLGLSGLHVGTIVALMAGGVLAAPVAARLAGRLPAEVLGVIVGVMILNLNLGPVLALVGALVPSSLGLPAGVLLGARVAVLVLSVALVVGVVVRRALRNRAPVVEERPNPVGAAVP